MIASLRQAERPDGCRSEVMLMVQPFQPHALLTDGEPRCLPRERPVRRLAAKGEARKDFDR
jgi:hypothetical protein